VGFVRATAIALLQFVLANVVTLLVSFSVNMQPEENPFGVVVVLGIALALGQVREASPFLTGSMLAGIAGFHVPGWVLRAPKVPVATS